MGGPEPRLSRKDSIRPLLPPGFAGRPPGFARLDETARPGSLSESAGAPAAGRGFHEGTGFSGGRSDRGPSEGRGEDAGLEVESAMLGNVRDLRGSLKSKRMNPEAPGRDRPLESCNPGRRSKCNSG